MLTVLVCFVSFRFAVHVWHRSHRTLSSCVSSEFRHSHRNGTVLKLSNAVDARAVRRIVIKNVKYVWDTELIDHDVESSGGVCVDSPSQPTRNWHTMLYGLAGILYAHKHAHSSFLFHSTQELDRWRFAIDIVFPYPNCHEPAEFD